MSGKKRGPPPKPTVLSKLQGNPSKRALNENEPDCPQDDIAPPAHLDEEARREWNHLSPWAIANQMLRNDTVQTFAAYCQSASDYAEATTKLKENGKVNDGRASPWAALQDKAFRRMHSMALEFGLTASSRSRIMVPDKGKGDAFDDFLGNN